MDTTQKNREQTPRRPERPREEQPKRRASAQAAPPSAQQRNGAVRTAEGQRSGATAPRKSGGEAPKKRSAAPQARPEKAKASKSLLSRKKAPVKASKTKEAPEKKRRPAPKPGPNLDDMAAKKRSYGNSKPKKTASSTISDIYKQFSRQDEEGTKKKKSSRPKIATPAVIYTQPQAFNRSRLLVQLATITAVVAAMVMGISVFFKVETILVNGASVYSERTVIENSGIEKGDNLLTFSRPRAGALIKANLPYVDTVRFGIKLPGTVNIIIEEDDVVYAIKDQVDAWWLINSDGRVVEAGSGSKHVNHTQVLGVSLESPVPNTIGVATELLPTQTDPATGEFIPVTVTNEQRLNAALQILRALESNDLVGSAASVDVSRLDDIILWYGTRYQVNLGDSSNLDYKVACMNDVILQMSDYQSGILDISFSIWPNQVVYTPFS